MATKPSAIERIGNDTSLASHRRLKQGFPGASFAAVAAGCFCIACASAWDLPEPPARPALDLPASFTAGTAAGAHEPSEWWRAFGDPALDRVVDAALASNLDLGVAAARVEQARARSVMAANAHRPAVNARAGIDGFTVPTNSGIGAQLADLGLGELLNGELGDVTLPDRLDLTTYTLGADFSYEVDLWDRMGHASLAARAELLASDSDARAVRIGVLAETIAAYFEIVDLRRRIALAGRTVDVLEEREQLAATRYQRGLADSLDLYRVREDLRNTQSSLPQLRRRLTEAQGRLAVLLGGYRQRVTELLPEGAAPPRALAEAAPMGVPVDLLRQRPDLQAAALRMDAADHMAAARRAELLPSLSFAGSVGLQAVDATGIFDIEQWFANLFSNLLAPIVDRGRRKGNVALAHARFDELAAAWGRTVLTAVNEVEVAFLSMRHEVERHSFLTERREEAAATLELRTDRFESGLGEYAGVLDASRTLLNVETAVSGAERDLALARLAVHRALGGAWVAPDAGEAPLAGIEPPLPAHAEAAR